MVLVFIMYVCVSSLFGTITHRENANVDNRDVQQRDETHPVLPSP